MKKLMALLMVLAMVFALASCGSKQEDPAPAPEASSSASGEEGAVSGEEDVVAPEIVEARVGFSEFFIQLPEGYAEGEMTVEDVEDGQVAYYCRGEEEMDFDVYQFAKADEDADSLFAYVAAEAAEYGVSDLKEEDAKEINGIKVYSYNAVEEFEGKEYATVTYAFEDDKDFFELVFWMDAEDSQQAAAAQAVAESLRQRPFAIDVALGETGYSIQAPAFYYGDLDGSEDLIAYLKSDFTTMDFDVYAWEAEEGDTLASYAEEEAMGREVTTVTINDVEICYYMDEEEDAGESYTTKTCIVYNDGHFAELVFWLDGDTAVEEADAILNTIA